MKAAINGQTADWNDLQSLKLSEAAAIWLQNLENRNTRVNYRSGLNKLFRLRIINRSMTLAEFAQINSNVIVDRIKNQRRWSEATRQARAACFISFTKSLDRRTEGKIRQAVPEKFGIAKTFFAIREKVKTKAMDREEYQRFRAELQKINPKHRLISDVILQGIKRISEVLSLKIADIDFETGRISFRQSKTRGKIKWTVITYHPKILREIRETIGTRERGYVFIENRRRILRGRLNYSFAIAGARSGIEFKITPHVLRATGTTLLKGKGYPDDAIGKMTGTSPQQVGKYDKTDIADNPSMRENLTE